MPYRTLDNLIDGVVMTFSDVTALKVIESKVQIAQEYAQNIVDTVREPLIAMNGDFTVISASRSFYKTFGETPEGTIGRTIYKLGNGQWDIPRLHELLEVVLPKDVGFENVEIEQDFPNIGTKTMRLYARRIISAEGTEQFILLGIEDVTERKRVEQALQVTEARFDQLAEQSNTVTWEADIDGLFTYVSSVSEVVWGYRPDELVGKMHFYDLVVEVERETIKSKAFEVLKHKERFAGLEHAVQAKDGHILWNSTSGIPLLSADGTLRGYQGSDTDITESKRIQDEIKKSRDELKALNRKLKRA
jgi:PAS domain S-box-containing protein